MADNKDLKKDVELKEGEEKDNLKPIADDKNEIKETTGTSVEIYDEDDDTDVEEYKKPKKKIKKRWIVLGIVLLLVGFFVVRGMIASKNYKVPVAT